MVASCSCVSGTVSSPSIRSIAAMIHFAVRCSNEWPAELDHDARIGRQISLADNSADGAFAADQNGFDVAAVLVANQVCRKTRSARKVDDLDIVAGIIEQFAGSGLFVHEMRRNQCKVAGAEPPQQVVEWPFDAVRCCSAQPSHPWTRSSGIDQNRLQQAYVCTSAQ